MHELFRQVFHRLIGHVFADGQDGDRVGMEIKHPGLDKSILVPFSTPARLTADKLMTWIEKIRQSKKGLALDEEMTVKFVRIRPPQGRGWRKESRGHWETWYNREITEKKGCLIAIKNEDGLCAARALVLDLARQQQNESPQHKTRYQTLFRPDRAEEGIRRTKGSAQKRAAQQLMESAGLGDFEGAVGIPELKLLEEAMNRDPSHPPVRVKVFSKEHCGAIVYAGVPEDAPITLCLYHWGEHYDV
ncbi:MAG: hypothetical protein GY835_24230, partial [bacterium]|nr:hypothetical protein [bacterium]